MPLQKLSKADLMGDKRSAGANTEYVKFLRGLKPGDGGKTSVEAEGVSQQTIKMRLKKAAAESNMQIKFHRAPKGEVKFQVISKA